MTLKLAIVIAVTVTVVGAGPVAAGDAAGASAPRVRVLAPAVSEKPIVGQLVGSDEASITILRAGHGGLGRLGWPFRRAQGGTLTLPRESVTRFERSVRPSRRQLGAWIGGGVGFAVGLVIVERNKTSGHCDQCAMAAAIIGSPLALLGYAVAPGERWGEEDPRKVRVGIAPAPGGGVSVRLSVNF